MPISRVKIRSVLHPVTLAFEGTDDTLTLWIKPELITPKFQRALRQTGRELARRQADLERRAEAGEDVAETLESANDEAFAATVRMMTELIAEWDLLEDDKTQKKAPITAEVIEDLGLRTIIRINTAISESLTVDPTKPRPSGSGFAVVDAVVSPQNGSFS